MSLERTREALGGAWLLYCPCEECEGRMAPVLDEVGRAEAVIQAARDCLAEGNVRVAPSSSRLAAALRALDGEDAARPDEVGWPEPSRRATDSQSARALERATHEDVPQRLDELVINDGLEEDA